MGMLISHVDDLLFAGEGKEFEESIEYIDKAIQLTMKNTPLVFCGKKVEQEEDGTVTVTQVDAAKSIKPISLSRGLGGSSSFPR